MYTSLILYEGNFFSNFKYSCFLPIEMLIIMSYTLQNFAADIRHGFCLDNQVIRVNINT